MSPVPSRPSTAGTHTSTAASPRWQTQTLICIRPARDTDTEAVHRFLADLSPDAQHRRFFNGLGLVSPSLVRQLVAVTPRQQVNLALLGEVVIGHAMTTTAADGVIELGVVVADGHRRQGVATMLVRDLLQDAAKRGVDQLRLDVLCDNHTVRDWIQPGLPGTRFERDGHTLTGYARFSDAAPPARLRTA
jgi:GNAT superfamily N-acetyltransferase